VQQLFQFEVAAMKKATKFNRIFDPEFLAARKDITGLELSCAKGEFDVVVNALHEKEDLLDKRNKDGNTLLLLAVANGRVELTEKMLEMKADIHSKNSQRMDAIDYAVMASVGSPMAKVVFGQCDFIVPEILEGAFEKRSKQLVIDLMSQGLRLARTSVIGKTPEFNDPFSRSTEYRTDWLKKLRFVSQIVKRGVLLLDDDIFFIERDALLSGALEVPVSGRYMYLAKEHRIVKFSEALKSEFAVNLDGRLCEAAHGGNALAVQGLLKAKATPSVEDRFGETVLARACNNGDSLTIKCLIVGAANVNAGNKEGYSPLHLASIRAHADAVRVLLTAKADLFGKTNKGYTALDFVKHEGHKEILYILNEDRALRRQAKK